MDGIIVTTPAQLKDYIEASVKEAVSNCLQAIKAATIPAPTVNNQPEFITRREAADKLRISLNTLDTYTRSGKVTGYRIGTRILYKSNEIDTAVSQMANANVRP